MTPTFSRLQVWSSDDFMCDGHSASSNCKGKSSLTICKGCGLALCKHCYAEHQEEVLDD
jgi:hypothetical protein